jgi:hypothetical protein
MTDDGVYPCRECGQHVYEDELGKCESCHLGDLCTRCSGFDGHVCIDCVVEESEADNDVVDLKAYCPPGQDPDDEDFRP